MDRTTRSRLFSIFIFTTLFYFLFSIPSYAQGVGSVQYPAKRPHRETKCPKCEGLVDMYNDLSDKEFKEQVKLYEINVSIQEDNRMLDEDRDHLNSLRSMPDSKQKAEQIANAESLIKQDLEQLAKDSDARSAQVKVLEDIWKDETRISGDIAKCERAYCGIKTALVTPPPSSVSGGSTYFASSFSPVWTGGVLFGNINLDQSGHIETPFGIESGSHSQNNIELGLQTSVQFGTQHCVNPAITASGAGVFNASNTLFNEMPFPTSATNAKLTVSNNVLGRVTAGVQSKLFYNAFSVGFGVGGAIIDQSLTANSTGTIGGNVTQSRTSFQPSFLFNVTWDACPACLSGHGVFVTGQVAVDRYPSMQVSGISWANVGQQWQPSEMIVISTRLNP